jgi:hypothetical protein
MRCVRLKSFKRALIWLYLYLALADSRWYMTFALQPHLSLISALLRSFVARFDIAALACVSIRQHTSAYVSIRYRRTRLGSDAFVARVLA